MRFFERTIFAPSNQDIKLITVNTDTHMNVVVNDTADLWSREHAAVSLPVEKAIELRDALIEAYPLPKTEPENSEYRVNDREFDRRIGSPRYLIEQDRVERRTVTIGSANTEADARKIVQALNEAEGL